MFILYSFCITSVYMCFLRYFCILTAPFYSFLGAAFCIIHNHVQLFPIVALHIAFIFLLHFALYKPVCDFCFYFFAKCIFGQNNVFYEKFSYFAKCNGFSFAFCIIHNLVQSFPILTLHIAFVLLLHFALYFFVYIYLYRHLAHCNYYLHCILHCTKLCAFNC